MLKSKFGLSEGLKNLNTTRNLQSNKHLINFQKFYFARIFNWYVPIYRQDEVVVLPPWGSSPLSNVSKRMVNKYHIKEKELFKGKVIKVLRKKNMVIVKGKN